MIKTTSFAPVRSGKTLSNPSSKVAARQNAIKAAKARATAQPTLSGLFADPTEAPEISASQARELMQSAASKSKPKVATSAQKAPESKAEIAAPVEITPVAMTSTESETAPTKKAARTAKAKTALPAETPAVAPIEAAPVLVEAAPIEVVAAPPPVVAKKTKRARVPENLAEQYGQSLSKRVEGGVEAAPAEDETPKKRRTRAETQARRELMKPDDDLIARLRRAQNAVPTRKAEKRPAGWRFDCGRCGHTSYFQTSGALCSCGALAIKE